MKTLTRYSVESLFNIDEDNCDQQVCLSEDVKKLEELMDKLLSVNVILIVKSGCVFGLNVPDHVNIEVRDYDIQDLNDPELKKDEEGDYYNPFYL